MARPLYQTLLGPILEPPVLRLFGCNIMALFSPEFYKLLILGTLADIEMRVWVVAGMLMACAGGGAGRSCNFTELVVHYERSGP